MIYEKIDLYAYFNVPREGREGGYLTVYVRDQMTEIKAKRRPAMLVIPGGGYEMVSEREGEPIAMRYLNAGFACFLLKYTVRTAYPVPLVEAGMAMAYVRLNADRYGVDPSHVAAVGFSAGGHLTGMLATLFGERCLIGALGEHAKLVRPDAVVLSYAVFTTAQKTHGGSAQTISGGDAELCKALSLETRVSEQSSPAFIWHTFEDDCVPVENALIAAKAYREHNVPFELHIFEKGRHGLSTVDREVFDFDPEEGIARNAAWIELSLSFLKARGFTIHEFSCAKKIP